MPQITSNSQNNPAQPEQKKKQQIWNLKQNPKQKWTPPPEQGQEFTK